ncbi:MAG: M20/M25/M40 family metallo-hydrolase, partial [bacterium]|nr:M20/M25/M40 family metallo-hydrolase [bacterium]
FRTSSGFTLPVTVAEKGPAWRSLRLPGTPSHGSQPYGTDNALVGMAEAITRLAESPTPVDISPCWVEFISSIGLDRWLVEHLTDPDQIDAAIEEIDDPTFARWVHACTHLTVSPTVMSSGEKQNTIPDRGEASLDIRLTPGQDVGAVDDLLRKALGPALYDRLEVLDDLDFPANASVTAGPLWDAIDAAANELAGPATLVPMLTPVLTDGRFFRQRGVTAYGVGLFDGKVDFANSLAMYHGNNERVSVVSIDLTERMLAATLAEYGRRTAV